jgi:(S)-ureidoglycine-glyoxylate aminotransferase
MACDISCGAFFCSMAHLLPTSPFRYFRFTAKRRSEQGNAMFEIQRYPQINPPQRLLMGPGPINADPRVLRAMASPLIGQYDPAMTGYMNEVMALWREIFRTQNRWTMLVDGTSRAGIEAILLSAIRPGDRVLVPVFGRFGHLLCEIARRCRAEVRSIDVPWGEVFSPQQIEDAIKRVRPRLLLTVHGDTSTTLLQPLDELGDICRRYGVLFYTDATASLGGNELDTDGWGLDAVSAGLQKCLGGPSGSSPVTLSPRMEEVIRRRRRVEQGIRNDSHYDGDDEIIYSNYFDLGMIMDYWGPERLNHHTEATSMLFAARECARIILEEGLDNTLARHALHGRALAAGIQGMGLDTFGSPAHRMSNVLGVVIPAQVHGEAVRQRLLEDFHIEIGTSFGPLQGKIWRIGTMGYNARKDCVLQTLAALEAVLNRLGLKTVQGAAMQAAWDIYDSAGR